MIKQFGHTFSEVISLENLAAAWEEFSRGKKDKYDVMIFASKLVDNLVQLHEDLANFRYSHGGYYHFRICDPKPRDIHKAGVRDRVVHHAVHRLLYPFFDRTFIADSFSCRLGKGTHRALDRLRGMAFAVSRNHTRTCWILKCDIKKCFATIDHRILNTIIARYIPDSGIRWLLGQIVESFSSQLSGIGLPLGNLTSQLLVNVYLNELDQFVKHQLQARYYLRYADDFILLSEQRAWLADQLSPLAQFLKHRLRLELHPAKITLQTFASGVDFLGWVHFYDHRVLRQTTRCRMMRKIAERTSLPVVQSYRGLLTHGNAELLRQDLDQRFWIGTTQT